MKMNDGHTGTTNHSINRKETETFTLVLSHLEKSTNRDEFIIHITSNKSYGSRLHPFDFLQQIGLKLFSGRCNFHNDSCYYKSLASLRRDARGSLDTRHIQVLHQSFNVFSEKIEELYELAKEENEILNEIKTKSSRCPIFGPPLEIETPEYDIPAWIDEVKFQGLQELENEKNKLQERIDDLQKFLPLLYGTGDPLENAVIHSLRFLGIKAEKAEKGFSVDILAETESVKFGFEVTGISKAIKKESGKLTQVLDFERIKQHNEKTILLANTFNTISIDEREELDDFTEPVIDFLSGHPILLMTGWDLYRLIRDVLDGNKENDDVINMLISITGKYEYS